jgi:hypothetical protein
MTIGVAGASEVTLTRRLARAALACATRGER